MLKTVLPCHNIRKSIVLKSIIQSLIKSLSLKYHQMHLNKILIKINGNMWSLSKMSLILKWNNVLLLYLNRNLLHNMRINHSLKNHLRLHHFKKKFINSLKLRL